LVAEEVIINKKYSLVKYLHVVICKISHFWELHNSNPDLLLTFMAQTAIWLRDCCN